MLAIADIFNIPESLELNANNWLVLLYFRRWLFLLIFGCTVDSWRLFHNCVMYIVCVIYILYCSIYNIRTFARMFVAYGSSIHWNGRNLRNIKLSPAVYQVMYARTMLFRSIHYVLFNVNSIATDVAMSTYSFLGISVQNFICINSTFEMKCVMHRFGSQQPIDGALFIQSINYSCLLESWLMIIFSA